MRYLIFTAPLLLMASALYAQNNLRDQNNNWNRGRQSTLSGGLEIGIPKGVFADTWGREIVGLSANFSMPMRRLPLETGFDFAWGSMGGERKGITLEDPNMGTTTTGDLSVNSNVYGYHGLLRFKPLNGAISPYIEGLAGLRHFSTRTKLRESGSSEPLEKERRSSQFAGSLGWAVGLQVAPRNRAFFVEGRVERLNGGNVTYVDPRTITISPNGEVNFETLSSPTRTVNVHLGIGLRF